VGFENNMQLVSGELASDNSALITQVVDAVEPFQRPSASGMEARAIMQLSNR
jgi:uncharacterized protein (DUF849 family)